MERNQPKNVYGLAVGFFRQRTVESFRAALAAGFTELEMGMKMKLGTDDMFIDAQRELKLLREAGLHVRSIHLPYGEAWDISEPGKAKRRARLELLRIFLHWAASEGITAAVLHASSAPIRANERGLRLRVAEESIGLLGAFSREAGIQLAVENLPGTALGNQSGELLTLTGGGKHAGICFDVNHLTLEAHGTFLRRLGERVITTHLSDYDGARERHWPPGDGVIDWPALLRVFAELNYAGPWIFEFGACASPSGQCVTPAALMDRFLHYQKES
ncbi:MAG: sugar phosphate isomerase/epimerase [Oscillospiraceae bacterium]|nr:sugar phosphate isomerase/epimerase [Oscillospiraceae bacterium]